MSQRVENFHHIDDLEAGIFRELGEGISTRIFPGQQAMISVVRVGPNAIPEVPFGGTLKGFIQNDEGVGFGFKVNQQADYKIFYRFEINEIQHKYCSSIFTSLKFKKINYLGLLCSGLLDLIEYFSKTFCYQSTHNGKVSFFFQNSSG